MSEVPVFTELPDFVGEGDFPAELDRANWGAALFSYIWVWLYGVKPWIIGLTALFVVPLVIENGVLLLVGGEYLPRAQAVLDPISMVAWWVVVVYFGLNANRIVWAQQHRRFEQALGEPARPIPMWRYRKSTTFWSRLGLGLIAAGALLEVLLLIFRPESRTLALTSWPTSWIPLAVLLVLDRMRSARLVRQS